MLSCKTKQSRKDAVEQVVGAVGWGGNRLEPPEECTPVFAQLMNRCFADELKDRPSFEMIIWELQNFASKNRQAVLNAEDGLLEGES